jgi:phosphoribosylanthranilate isomerase
MTDLDMTWVKICGMTNLEDALVAADAGADAVGFVFYEKSPRCVTVEKAREICEKLPEAIEKVGIFVGATEGTLIKTSKDVGLTAVQVYPGENNRLPTLKDEFPRNVDVIMALPAEWLVGRNGDDTGDVLFAGRVRERTLAVLVDSGSADRPGGTGEKFNWEHAELIREEMKWLGVPLIVAGGLVPENVGNAIDVFQPWGVDVVSGVEASPGKKDPEKVRAFVRAVREMDRRVV